MSELRDGFKVLFQHSSGRLESVTIEQGDPARVIYKNPGSGKTRSNPGYGPMTVFSDENDARMYASRMDRLFPGRIKVYSCEYTPSKAQEVWCGSWVTSLGKVKLYAEHSAELAYEIELLEELAI